MNFNKHLDLAGQHAFLGASKYHWIRYDEDKLVESYSNWQAAQRGTRLHEFASECIKLGIKLPRTKSTLNMFVNDAIGYKMESEQVLYFSENCFGTADAISFKKDLLRIHDYKSGVVPANMDQLKIYNALFCLEYRIHPTDIGAELRIYQNDDVIIFVPEVDEIVHIMDKIITFDKVITKLKSEER